MLSSVDFVQTPPRTGAVSKAKAEGTCCDLLRILKKLDFLED
jgi:hypothetical protein